MSDRESNGETDSEHDGSEFERLWAEYLDLTLGPAEENCDERRELLGRIMKGEWERSTDERFPAGEPARDDDFER